MISDGIRFLLSLLLQVLPTQLLTYGLLTLSEGRTSLSFNFISKVLISILASFLQVFIWKSVKVIRVERDARRLGAKQPPVLPSKRIGGLDILQDMLYEVEHGYLATKLTSYFEQVGHTFRMNVMGDTQVRVDDDSSKQRILTLIHR